MNRFAVAFFISVLLSACGKFEVLRGKKGGSISQQSTVCQQRLNGVWEFGRAPYGCAMSGTAGATLMRTYGDVVYNETKVSPEETKRFVREMYSFISDYSVAYLKRREPAAAADAIETWRHLILATAHQESYWTQYRFGKDEVFRFFRGDNGHGYGLMQIDDRWHKEFIASQNVYDLESHLVYALDMLFDARQATMKKPCPNAASGEALNRSIYSRYNGGPKSQCRWQIKSRWTRNDQGFLEKLNGKSWEKEL